LQAVKQKDHLTEAEKLLQYASSYIKRHDLKSQEEQGILATQMHELVTQQLAMLSG
jgi:hypothetical protein